MASRRIIIFPSLFLSIFPSGFPGIQGIFTGHAMKIHVNENNDWIVCGVWWGQKLFQYVPLPRLRCVKIY